VASWSHGANNPNRTSYTLEYADDCRFTYNAESVDVGSDTSFTIPTDPNQRVCVRVSATDHDVAELTGSKDAVTLAKPPANISVTSSSTVCRTITGEQYCFNPSTNDPVQFIKQTTEYAANQLPTEQAHPWQRCGLVFRDTDTGDQPLIRTCAPGKACNFRFGTSGFCQDPGTIQKNVAEYAGCGGKCPGAYPLQNGVPHIVESSGSACTEDTLWFKIQTEGTCDILWRPEGVIDRLDYSKQAGICQPTGENRGSCDSGDTCRFTAENGGTYYAQIEISTDVPAGIMTPAIITATAVGNNCEVNLQ
jgi:hypothetical protein